MLKRSPACRGRPFGSINAGQPGRFRLGGKRKVGWLKTKSATVVLRNAALGVARDGIGRQAKFLGKSRRTIWPVSVLDGRNDGARQTCYRQRSRGQADALSASPTVSG